MVARPGQLQATFNSGELSPELYQRTDVKQFYAGAALMRNVEPVPQGGFRLLDRSRDCGAERGGLAEVGGSLTTNVANGPPGRVVGQLIFAAIMALAVIRISYTASVDADGRLVVQYRDAGGTWRHLQLIALRRKRQIRAVGFPPGQPVTAGAVRVILAGTGDAAVIVEEIRPFTETAVPVTVQYAPFTYAVSTAYMLVLAGSGLFDVYRDGAWVGAGWHDGANSETAATQLLQRLDTGLLFHPDRRVRRLLRMAGGDHEWNLDEIGFDHVPQVDLGGTYTKIDERWQLVIRWPTANGGSPSGYIFVVTVDGVDTTAIGVPPDLDWNTLAQDIQFKLSSLSTVEPGVIVTPDPLNASGIKPFNIVFGGGNSGSQFTVSARIINNTDGGASTLRIAAGDPGGEDLFSAARGHPTSGIFYQDRLIQGGFRSKPGAMLASPTGDYYSGNIQVEAASGGILLNIDTDGAEQIVRFARGKHLCIFTTDAEYYISDRNVRRDQPVNVVESTRNGSARFVPVCSTETGLLYVSRARALVYAANYDDVQQAYVSEPISLLARHLVSGINGAALQRADDRSDAARYYLTRDDGVLLLGLLIRSQEVTAFVQWVTDGTVKAVCVDGANRVYLSVERTIGGVRRRRVERIEPGLLVDGAVTRTFAAPQALVGGLDMHEGATVWAQADGWWLGPFTVAGGAITLPIEARTVTVGRWTPPAATTLPLPRDIGNRQRLERPARVYAVSLHVLGTTSLAVGANGRPAEDVPLYRAGMPTDLPQQPISDRVLVEGLEGFSAAGQVTVTQVRPGPLQVGALTVSARL
jgi:hypothetical protein